MGRVIVVLALAIAPLSLAGQEVQKPLDLDSVLQMVRGIRSASMTYQKTLKVLTEDPIVWNLQYDFVRREDTTAAFLLTLLGPQTRQFLYRDSVLTSIDYTRRLRGSRVVPVTDALRSVVKYLPYAIVFKASLLEDALSGGAAILHVGDTLINGESCSSVKVLKARPDTSLPSFLSASATYYFHRDGTLVADAYVDSLFGSTIYNAFRVDRCEYNGLTTATLLSVIDSVLQLSSEFEEWPTTEIQEKPLLQVGTNAPRWEEEILQMYGQYRSAAKLTILDFWYASCAYCHIAAKHLNKILSEAQQGEIRALGLNPIDDSAAFSAAVATKEFEYPCARVPRSVAEDFHVSVYPTIYLLNTDGRVLWSAAGVSEQLIDELLSAIKREQE